MTVKETDQFLNTHSLPRLNVKEKENLNRAITSIEVEFGGTVGDITVNEDAVTAEANASYTYQVDSTNVTIQNVTATNVQVWIKSITINLASSTEVSYVDVFSDVDFRVKCGEVLAKDDDGTIIFSKYNYGKGKTYFLNCPVEKFTFENADSYISYPYYKIYQTVAEDILKDKPAISNDPNVCLTIHPKQDKKGYIVIAVNYSDNDIPCSVIDFKNAVKVDKVYGDGENIPACSAFVYEVKL